MMYGKKAKTGILKQFLLYFNAKMNSNVFIAGLALTGLVSVCLLCMVYAGAVLSQTIPVIAAISLLPVLYLVLAYLWDLFCVGIGSVIQTRRRLRRLERKGMSYKINYIR